MPYRPKRLTLLTAVVSSIFGHGSRHPIRAAVVRLAVLGFGAMACGIGLMRAVTGAFTSTLPEVTLLYYPALLATQAIVIAGLFAAHGVVHPPSSDRLSRWLLLLPISATYRYCLQLIPVVLLTILLSVVSYWPLVAILMEAGMSGAVASTAVASGSVSAMALYQATGRLSPLLHLVACAICIMGEYALIRVITSPFATTSDQLVAHATLAIGLSLVAVRLVHPTTAYTAHAVGRRPLLMRLPIAWWMITKCIRSSLIRSTLIASLCISGGLAYMCHQFGVTDTTTLALTASLLAAASAADSRMLCRRNRPVEIAGLHGTAYFVVLSMLALTPLILMSVSPLLWLLIQQHGLASTALLTVATGLLCGFCASTCVAPAPRNIGGQFAAVLLCVAFVFVIERLLADSVAPWLGHSLALPLLIIGTIAVEYKRNPYYWRSNHA